MHRPATSVRVTRISKKKLLLASQRIEVGALLNGTTLNPLAFRWGVADSETTTGAKVSRLEYSNGHSPAYFQFDHYLHKHYALYSWGNGEELEEHFAGTWCCTSPAGSPGSSVRPAPATTSSPSRRANRPAAVYGSGSLRSSVSAVNCSRRRTPWMTGKS